MGDVDDSKDGLYERIDELRHSVEEKRTENMTLRNRLLGLEEQLKEMTRERTCFRDGTSIVMRALDFSIKIGEVMLRQIEEYERKATAPEV